jgi:hypothetical protein
MPGPLEEEEREVRKTQATRARALDMAIAKWNAAEAKLKQCGTLVVDTEEQLVASD